MKEKIQPQEKKIKKVEQIDEFVDEIVIENLNAFVENKKLTQDELDELLTLPEEERDNKRIEQLKQELFMIDTEIKESEELMQFIKDLGDDLEIETEE